MTHHQGKFVWFELETRDVAAAQAFFGEVLGWRTRSQPAGETAYEMIEVAGQPIGGYRKLHTRSDPHWASFISVAELDEAIARAKGAGSRHIGEVLETPGVGTMVDIIDTVGAKVHLVTRRGGDLPERTPPPGAFLWTEMVTRLPDRAVDFYRTVFGYDVKPIEMPAGGTYYLLETGAVGRAGVLHRDTSPQWLPYVHVTDCDRTLERALRMGATAMLPPTDLPQVGRYAVMSDPQGADLAIMTPSPT